MKTINTYLLALMSVFMLTWTACTDSVDYDPAAALEGQGAYFAAASASYTVESTSGIATLQVYRSNKNGSTEIPLTVTYGEDVNNFVQVPTTVSFADGETAAIVNINYNNLVEGQAYKLNVSVSDVTPYAKSAISVSIMYSNEPVYTWEKVTEEAIYLDDMFGLIGKGSMKTKGITVEKAKEVNMYRFRSPYDNDYFVATWGGKLFPADFEFGYIILDGETYKDAEGKPLYYIKKTNLGFKMIVNSDGGATVTVDTEALIFGSIGANLSAGGAPIPPTSTEYPLGTYDAKKKIFNLGAVYQDIEGYGIKTYGSGKFMLYLDEKALVPNYDQDYTWMSMPGNGGLFTSELAGEWMQSIQQSVEDSTFYRLPNLYANGTAFYFYLDQEQGSVSVLKGQKSGLTTFGTPVYIEGTPGKSSYDVETGTVTFGLTFYVGDENGKKTGELTKVVETIQLGTEASSLLKGKRIDDYVGNWIVQVGGEQEGRQLANVSKLDEKTLGVVGLSLTGADDMVLLEYDTNSGLISFKAQEVASLSPLVDNLPVMIVPLNSTLTSLTTKESLIGGLTSDGILKFVNNSANEGIWDAMGFILIEDNKPSLLTGLWNYIDWIPYIPTSATAAFKVHPSITNQDITRNIMPRRIYKTELNIKPTPLQVNDSMKMKLIDSLKGEGSFLQQVR